jgi:hypothetical protein
MTALRIKQSLLAMTAALALALPLAMSLTTTADAGQRGEVAPFCVKTGSSGGPDGAPTDCRYFSYRQCLENAIGGGNCVANIDYRGSYVRVNGEWAATR